MTPPVLDLDGSAAGAIDADDGVPTLEAVVPTWSYQLDDAALIVFDQEMPHGVVTLQSTPRRVRNRGGVTLRTIAADGVRHKPMAGVGQGLVGHVFQLLSASREVCRIEVTTAEAAGAAAERDAVALRRVAIVQSGYTPLALAAGIADASSLLVYEDPEAHLERLASVRAEMDADADLGYMPLAEACCTSALDQLPLVAPRADASEATRARLAWGATRSFLKRMSTLASDCTDRHARAEIRRAGVHELTHASTAWRQRVL